MHFLMSDFHTDVLSSCLSADYIEKYLNQNNFVQPVLAIFSRNGENIDSQICKYNILKSRNPMLRLSFENLHFLEYRCIDAVRELQPLCCSLTWNDDNVLGGGCTLNNGLTKFGKDVARGLSDSGIYIDTAHLSKKSFTELVDIGVRLVNTHTCFCDVFDHKRNIDGFQIASIIESGGIVGLTTVGSFLCDGEATIDGVVKHVDYFCEHFSSDKLCIGTDLFGTEDFVKNLKNYKMYANLVEKLLKIGYNNRVIKNILHDNLSNFMRLEVLND